MKKTKISKILSAIVCIVLIAAMALFTIGCNDKTNTDTSSAATSDVSSSASASNVLGTGATQFTFTVTDLSGTEKSFTINTDKKTVGEALIELGLIAGEQGDYGLYVKTVNGVTVDYETDGKYWAFYADGQYSMTGVDATEIKAGSTYSFKAE